MSNVETDDKSKHHEWYQIFLWFSLLTLSTLVSCDASADNHLTEVYPLEAAEVLGQDFVSYPARYFDRFHPSTALDMVRQVPGFQVDDNINDIRGFGGVAGNLLINDRRPSSKKDSLSAILARIPASYVQQIELIRGQVRSIDLRGQSSVANIILLEGIPASIQWETALKKTFNQGPVKPEGSMSLSDNWKGIDFNVGLNLSRTSAGRNVRDERYTNHSVLEEQRFESRDIRNTLLKSNLNVSSWWGETYLNLNTVFNYAKRRIVNDSDRIRLFTEVKSNVLLDDIEKEPVFETSISLERNIHTYLSSKAIILYVQGDLDFLNTQRDTDSSGNQTLFREAVGSRSPAEVIARLEFDWTGLSGHLIQTNLEGTYNILESNLVQIDNAGAGPVIISVPGANSRVEEVRWDVLIKDTWMLEHLEFDYGIGSEISTIKQSGDTNQERNFFFLKPQGVLTYSHTNSDQTRLRMAREVAQLDLNDFVTSTIFLDDDLSLGNPDIKPDTTWIFELEYEKRYGGGVFRVSVFHHWIADVLDLLPVTTYFEVPGNIGKGRRWGLRFETTIPLDSVGLNAAKLNFKARWQDSTVVDPVSGEKRVLSIGTIDGGPIVFNNENEYAFEIDYRQDFKRQRFAWGWSVRNRAKQFQFKVDELETYDEGVGINVFIETTRWLGVKTRFGADNILNFKDNRNRTRYVSERVLSATDSIELRQRTRGIQLQLIVSGSF